MDDKLKFDDVNGFSEDCGHSDYEELNLVTKELDDYSAFKRASFNKENASLRETIYENLKLEPNRSYRGKEIFHANKLPEPLMGGDSSNECKLHAKSQSADGSAEKKVQNDLTKTKNVTVLQTLDEQAERLRRLDRKLHIVQIACIVLGILLASSLVTLSVMLHLSKTRLDSTEKLTGNLQTSLSSLQAASTQLEENVLLMVNDVNAFNNTLLSTTTVEFESELRSLSDRVNAINQTFQSTSTQLSSDIRSISSEIRLVVTNMTYVSQILLSTATQLTLASSYVSAVNQTLQTKSTQFDSDIRLLSNHVSAVNQTLHSKSTQIDSDIRLLSTHVSVVNQTFYSKSIQLDSEILLLSAHVSAFNQTFHSTSTQLSLDISSVSTNIGSLNQTLQSTSTQLKLLNTNVGAVNQSLLSLSAQHYSDIRSISSNVTAVSQSLRTTSTQISSQITQLSFRISDTEEDFAEFKGQNIIGFTARAKKDYVSGALRFNYIVTEVGGGYSQTSGIFTAPVSGLYLVSFTLQLETTGRMYCYIYHNGASTGVDISIYGQSQEPGSQTVIIDLNQADTIYIGGCYNDVLIGDESSFTVALLHTNTPTVGFTARGWTHHINDKLTFTFLVTEIWEGYNHTSGIFTAPVVGLYLVSFTLQLEHTNRTYCDLNHNGISTGVQIDISGYAQEPGSQTVIVELKQGDTVYIGPCYSAGLMGDESTFTVVLLHASKPKVGFTVREKKGYVDSKLTFKYIVTEVGGGYNHSSGMFTAPVSGLYLVSFTLQLETTGYMYCYIYRNGVNTNVDISINGRSQEPGSQTVVYDLNKGDTIYIGGCYNNHLMGNESTFTVVLLHETYM